MSYNIPQSFSSSSASLSSSQIERYARQLILPPPFGGVKSLEIVLSSTVVVIGAGGLASPLLLYLSAAGVGNLVIVDGDRVEESNLHRQIIHTTDRKDILKVESAKASILELNPSTKVKTIAESVDHDNIDSLLRAVLEGCESAVLCDCTDNQPTRYLISDYLKLYHPSVPLVSASAVGLAGQLTVINAKNGGCYRCLFPRSSNSCQSCADGGVLGPVVGTLGTLQATEAIKVLVGGEVLVNKLLVYDAFSSPVFRTVGIPPRKKCALCGENPSIKTLEDSKKAIHPPPTSPPPETPPIPPTPIPEVDCTTFSSMLQDSPATTFILDVRPSNQYSICHLPNSISLPLASLSAESLTSEIHDRVPSSPDSKVGVICRRGNASRKAMELIASNYSGHLSFVNVRGGVNEWHHTVDPKFPLT